MNRILVIGGKDTDLARLIQRSCPDAEWQSPDIASFDKDRYGALCLLGGDLDAPLLLSPSLRVCVEEFRATGKPVFSEFLHSIGGSYIDTVITTTHHRMVYAAGEIPFDGLCDGDVLDDRNNTCINYCFRPKNGARPLLSLQDYICAHDHIDMDAETFDKGIWALWMLDRTLVCSFRLCNFRRARLAPRRYFEALITGILSYLAGEHIPPDFEAPVCTYRQATVKTATDTDTAVQRALSWFQNASVLKNGGRDGAHEGFTHHILAQNGMQKRINDIRTDCTCEVGGAYLFHANLTGNTESRKIAESLFKFCYDWMQIKDGAHRGMLRWSEIAWETCYGDDVARAVLPLLLQQYFGTRVPYFENICAALDYLIDTTGPEGLRVSRTDCCRLTPEKRAEITSPGVGIPCAHHNAYYHATLLLAYRAGAPKRFLEVGEKGLSSIMSLYPNTLRETSETEECCRLILPLAILYDVTGKQEHYDWLCRVCDDLESRRHEAGAYPEWDTGYQAKCSRNHTGECALLANNGDPVVDLLYSNNWLPLGFSLAYLVTGETRFHRLWEGIASFLLSCQIHSEDTLLDGAWARAFDLKHWECHGVPHDIGWAPCCIETGWTMGEILMGLQFMHVAEEKHK